MHWRISAVWRVPVTSFQRMSHTRRVGFLFSLLLLATAVYYGINIGSVFLRYWQMQSALRAHANLAASLDDATIRALLVTEIEEFDLSEAVQNLKIARYWVPPEVHIATSWHERLELPFFASVVTFRPKATVRGSIVSRSLLTATCDLFPAGRWTDSVQALPTDTLLAELSKMVRHAEAQMRTYCRDPVSLDSTQARAAMDVMLAYGWALASLHGDISQFLGGDWRISARSSEEALAQLQSAVCDTSLVNISVHVVGRGRGMRPVSDGYVLIEFGEEDYWRELDENGIAAFPALPQHFYLVVIGFLEDGVVRENRRITPPWDCPISLVIQRQ